MDNEKQALINELKSLLEQVAQSGSEKIVDVKDQVDEIKGRFFRLYHEKQAALRQAAEEAAARAGEVLGEWTPETDEEDGIFQALMNEYKTKRAEVSKKLDEEMAQNLLRKQNIIEQMKAMAEAETADVMGNLQKMRDLQAEWKTIGAVPPTKVQEIWKQYQQYQEQFYDLVKINIELRDLDFKKNLELKTLLCEAAEKLKDNANIVEASRALQQLHDEWAETGPVARELREEIWNRFKEASSVINKKHQAYFDGLHAKENENLAQKQAIIEELKKIDFSSFKTGGQWDKAADKIQQLQNQWRTIGFAPKKHNQAIYDEYRHLCESFFKAKASFYHGLRDVLGENLAKKRALIERAEALQNSEDWQQTAQALIELQKEWKTTGAVARKYSDELWKKFTDTCDAFFNRKREAVKEAKSNSRNARVERAMAGGDRARLVRMYENISQDIKTAENNILFFTGKSKAANKLVTDMQQKIEALKKQQQELEDKINAIDAAQ